METTARTSIEPLFKNILDGGIVISTGLDLRYNGKEQLPIVVRVTYQRERFFYGSGAKVTPEDYQKLLSSYGTKGKVAKSKVQLQEVHDKVMTLCKKMNSEGSFSLSALKKELKPKVTAEGKKETLFQLWMSFAETKNTVKTRQQYISAATSFFKARGCKNQRVRDDDNKLSRRMALSGKALSMKPDDIDTDTVKRWISYMTNEGNSNDTQSMYLRAFRCLLIHLQEQGTIKDRPKFEVGGGNRRRDNYCKVPDILKIMAYEGQYKQQADFWIIDYLCNGANLKDLSELRYRDEDKRNNELSFVRSKTRAKNQERVYIPIIPQLQTLLDKYAAPYKDGELVFPQILAGAKTETQKDNRVHDFNGGIRQAMLKVCQEIGIPPVTPSSARNSYMTVLGWHGISDRFIDDMTGHTGINKVLKGYQAQITPKKRAKINSLLLIDPEADE